ncbi:hypothetical protein BCR44DRAFT_1446571 [Catenaria anguillulae PL171]|uniref:Uncharacterized protein n=1 Tax=Catenaria anguillulae PL171 TaxID=765915 RepID=A0A1Y2H602_9FUNG|nr:hypothetical protein BCR44DRAFT_1446571 [Catenaria anguillulae PL171]
MCASTILATTTTFRFLMRTRQPGCWQCRTRPRLIIRKRQGAECRMCLHARTA